MVRAPRRRLPKEQFKLDVSKCRKLLRAHCDNRPDGETTYALYADFATRLVGYAKGEGIGALRRDTDESWHDLVEHHGMYLDSQDANIQDGIAVARRLLNISNEAAKLGNLDYDDLLYLVTLWKLRLWQNDVVIVDEAQDVSKVRLAMLRLSLRDGGRLYAIGDEKQCHPPGTNIYISGRGYIPIENVKPGEQVMSYCYGYFPGKNEQGRKVLEVASRDYEGEMLRLTAGEYSHDVTPNHKCLVRLSSGAGSLVYVMLRGNHARVGRCSSKEGGDFGLATRCRQEKADAAWIIGYFDDGDTDAKLLELHTAYRFGLPQLCFFYSWENGTPIEQRNKFWKEFPDNVDNLKRCLIHYGLDIELPFWTKEDTKTHVGSKYSFVTYAVNIISGRMNVCLFDGSPHHPRWETVKVERFQYKGEVWSLRVEPNQMGRSLYVADGIVTHNCIYGFTGAMTDAMDLIAREFSTQTLPLTVSYRCAQAVVERAQTWVPYIEASPTAPEGDVFDEVPLHQAIEMLSPTDAILCRQTAPLVELAYALIAKSVPCRILGREIGEGLVKLVEQQRARGIDRLIEKLTNWRDREMAKFIAQGAEQRAEAVNDRTECVFVIIATLPETSRTVPALIAKIRGMFTDPERGAPQTVLTLATNHRAKGQEWNKVAILRPDLMPSKAARQDWAYDQELNLMYVAATRAKETLIYCKDGDMCLNEK